MLLLEFPAAFRLRLSLLPCFDQEAASGSQHYKALGCRGSSRRPASPSESAPGPASPSVSSDTDPEGGAAWSASSH
eukprot:12382831-Alexandrium_andersonii.AAC.1